VVETQKESLVRYLKALFLLLVIVGGVNWLLVGLAKIDLVAALTGAEFGQTNPISSVVYVLVGVSAIALVPTLVRWLSARDEAVA
jgi:uncharacterized protein